MKFAHIDFDANGQAAFALVCALIEQLETRKALSALDVEQLYQRARRFLPSQPNRRDEEAQQMIQILVDARKP